jgi:curli biogenesis system outer membrane secretion channel CsgG
MPARTVPRPTGTSRAFAQRGLAAALSAVLLAGCASTTPTLGGGQDGTVATGSTAGEVSAGVNPQLERCSETLGTIAVEEDTRAPWYADLQSRRLGPTTPVLRMMIQQSNCFVVVERGRALDNAMRERRLDRTGEMRAGSNVGGGQMVAADYTISPSVQFASRGTEGLNLGGFGRVGSVLGTVGGSVRANEASSTLLMVDNRSGVQLAAAQGSARNWDVGGVAGMFGGALGATGGGYSNTPEGRIIVAALMDAYSQLVRAIRSYRAQQVKGGLGTGGTLGVQGGTTPASRALQPAPAPPPAGAPPAPPPR